MKRPDRSTVIGVAVVLVIVAVGVVSAREP
jgi:hypothetical protein